MRSRSSAGTTSGNFTLLNRFSRFILYHICIHMCLGCHYCLVFSNTVTLFFSWEAAFVVAPLRNSFSVPGRSVAKTLYFVRDVFDNISKVCILDLEVCLLFSRNVFRNNFLSFFWRSCECSLNICFFSYCDFVSADTI